MVGTHEGEGSEPTMDEQTAAANATRVSKAMSRVARKDFLPDWARSHAASDFPLDIGHGQTNSQPSTVVDMLRLLDVRAGQRVLDVGSGSGWTTALLGELVGSSGAVIGVERIPELARRARAVIEHQGRPWVEVRDAVVGVLGAPEDAPFDRILVSAESDRLPDALVIQLGEGGVMVLPVAGVMLRVERTGQGVQITRHGYYRFVPLIED